MLRGDSPYLLIVRTGSTGWPTRRACKNGPGVPAKRRTSADQDRKTADGGPPSGRGPARRCPATRWYCADGIWSSPAPTRRRATPEGASERRDQRPPFDAGPRQSRRIPGRKFGGRPWRSGARPGSRPNARATGREGGSRVCASLRTDHRCRRPPIRCERWPVRLVHRAEPGGLEPETGQSSRRLRPRRRPSAPVRLRIRGFAPAIRPGGRCSAETPGDRSPALTQDRRRTRRRPQ